MHSMLCAAVLLGIVSIDASAADSKTEQLVKAAIKKKDAQICNQILKMKVERVEQETVSCIMRVVWRTQDVKSCEMILKIKGFESISHKFADCMGLIASISRNWDVCKVREEKAFQVGCQRFSQHSRRVMLMSFASWEEIAKGKGCPDMSEQVKDKPCRFQIFEMSSDPL